jgi:RNA polymerase sigma-70 factor (ECF subfamily)
LGYIYDAYSSALYGVILKMMRSEDLAHDLLQEAFVKIWRFRDNFDLEKGALYTWMINITRNHCIDYLRSKRHKNSQQNHGIDNHVYGLESSQRFDPQHIGLNELIRKLPEEQQQIIEYAYFQGYTQKEISEEFDIPLGTVKSRAKAALSKLKQVFN